MQIATGKVAQGRVELDAELPEGASVAVIATDGDETFEVDAATEKTLLDAIAELTAVPMSDMDDPLLLAIQRVH
jgi:beta-lactam-binding protein with PASTA domain